MRRSVSWLEKKVGGAGYRGSMFRTKSIALALAVLVLVGLIPGNAAAQEASSSRSAPLKPLIMSAACPTCIWGPLAEFTREAARPFGYDIQICYNCNRTLSVPVVAFRLETPPLNEWDRILGDPEPPRGRVDFGVTNSHSLWYAYNGVESFAQQGPQRHLRAIAYIEDPHPIQLAVKADSGITDLRQIAANRMKVIVLADATTLVPPILAFYGLTRDQLASWGGILKEGFYEEGAENRDSFDVIITAHGGLANNVENDLLYEMSQKYDLRFLDLDPGLMATMAERYQLETATLPVQLIRGMDRQTTTIVRNGQTIFSRDDLPEEIAYALAKAIDENQDRLKYLNRPYFYNVRTVAKGIGNVPLHRGAERYYREVGYIR